MAKPLTLPLADQLPRGSMNLRFQMVFANYDAPMQAPGWRVPPGAIVTLRPVNGSRLNTGTIFVSETPEGTLNSTASLALIPGADVAVPWPIDNLAELWACSQAAGDGLLITVQQQSIG